MVNTILRRHLSRLLSRENLTRGEARELLEAMLRMISTDAQIAAALVALSAKGETVEELAGMAVALRERAVKLSSCHTAFIDTAGTGSSRAKTFNVSTAAAFVIAGAGLVCRETRHIEPPAVNRECGCADSAWCQRIGARES